MLALIRGAGDIATGIALRLFRAGIRVAMLEVAEPTTIRRTVAFSEAVRLGECAVEGVAARLASSVDEARGILDCGAISVLVDPGASCPGAEQQAQVLALCPHREQQQIPFRLLHLVDPPALQPVLQFPGQSGNTYSVQRHYDSSVMAENSSSILSSLPCR